MDLLIQIKDYLTILKEANLYDGDFNISTLENIADKCYSNHYNVLTKYLVLGINTDTYNLLKEKLEQIKEIIKNEKN